MVKSSLGWLGGRYDAVRGVVGVTSLSGQAKRRKKECFRSAATDSVFVVGEEVRAYNCFEVYHSLDRRFLHRLGTVTLLQ